MKASLSSPATPAGARASWSVASAAPHRLFFLAGASYALVVVGLWTTQQASLYSGLLPPFSFTVPFPFAHGWMMIYGVLGFFIFGFLLTTFPRWLDDRPVRKGVYVTAWGLLLAGGHLFWVGLFLSPSLVLAAGALTLAGYGVATVQCIAILSRSSSPGRYQQKFITAGMAAAMAGQLAAGWGVAMDEPVALALSLAIGLNLFLLVVVLAVVYRMVPFFTSVVTPGQELRRTPWGLHLLAALLVLRFALAAWPAPQWGWMADGALIVVLAREVVVWRFWQAPRLPLLVILYLAVGWFLLGLGLSCGESLYRLLSGATTAPFRLAALHAITLGGFGSLLIGISTRVTLGHSGRGLATTRPVAALLYGFQAVPLARIVPEVVGHWVPSLAVHGFWSGILWVGAFGWWLTLFAPTLLRPRVDGNPG